MRAAFAVIMCGMLASGPGPAADIAVAPGAGTLEAALATVAPGDTVRLQAGHYAGAVTISISITLAGVPGSVVDAGGQGRTITIDAPDVVIRGISVRGSGERLDVEDAGIFVTARGKRVLIENNHLEMAN
mgnify:CR=1 FL=1